MTDGVPSFNECACFTAHTNPNYIYRSDQMLIINKPSASYEQCEKWLRNKTDCQLAIQCLPLLWKAAISNGIDPVVLISQAMVETGFFKFGGVIDSSFHNTCGLKTTKGGGNYEANAHMRFKSWEEGIQAHADHLGLYAGSHNCPKYSPECTHQNKDCKANGTTKDPRHFTYLYGKCKTVKSLTGTWATDSQYDKKLMKFINEIQQTEVSSKETIKQITNNQNVKATRKKTGAEKWNEIKKGIKNGTINPFYKDF